MIGPRTIPGFLLGLMVSPLFGQTAGMVSFQGLIKDGMGNPVMVPVDLEFRIYDAQTLGNLVDMDGDGVTEDQDPNEGGIGEDAKQVLGVDATNGIVSTKFGPVSAKAFGDTPRWLQVSVDGTPLSRIEMATAPDDFITKGPWIDVRAFGAKGDGNADDSMAIQDAIDFAAAKGLGGVVYIPPGTYRITDPLILQNNGGPPCPEIDNSNGLIIQGDGYDSFLAFDRAAGSLIGLYGMCATNITVRNLRLGALPGTAGFGRGIAFVGGSNITIRDNDISGAGVVPTQGEDCVSARGGIWLGGGVTDVRVLDNNLHDNRTAHIIVAPAQGFGEAGAEVGAHRVQIRGNRCITDENATDRANYGILVFHSTYIQISGNYVEGMVQSTCSGNSDADGYGITVYGGNGSSHHHVLQGNTIKRTGGIGIYVQGSPYTTVTGNILEDVVKTQSATSLLAAGIGCNQGPASITGNVIRNVGVGNTSPNFPYGIGISSCIRLINPSTGIEACAEVPDDVFRGITVSGNTIESTLGYGIFLATGLNIAPNNSSIVGNTLVNTKGGIATPTSGLGPISGLTIIGNSIIREPVPGGNQGIFLEGVRDSVISGNVITNSGQQGIVIRDLKVGQSVIHRATRNVVSNNIVRDSGRNVPNTEGIIVCGTNNLITGNHSFNSCVGGPQGWAIRELGANNTLVGNDTAGDPVQPPLADINSSGAGAIISLNRGVLNTNVIQPGGTCGDGSVNGTSEVCDDGSQCEDLTTDCTVNPGVCLGIGGGSCAARDNGEGRCVADCSCIQVCGDRIEHGTEACDDGNTTPCDGCSSDCQTVDETDLAPVCGSGDQCGEEQCDDGNTMDDGNGCDAICQRNDSCGDNMVQNLFEQCDDGNTTDDGNGCDAFCQRNDSCGDGTFQSLFEQCEDGNKKPCDGCDESCVIEACGNGVLQCNEACDDGNTMDDGNGCDAICQRNDSCGDNMVQNLFEQCDDGNTTDDGNGCDAFCQRNDSCGDGTFQSLFEQCEDGNKKPCDGCSSDCQTVDETAAMPVCGSGDRCGMEECDPPGSICDTDLFCSGTCTCP